MTDGDQDGRRSKKWTRTSGDEPYRGTPAQTVWLLVLEAMGQDEKAAGAFTISKGSLGELKT